MTDTGNKRRKFNPPVHHYKDRVAIYNDYEVVFERSGLHYGSQSTCLPASGTTWKIGMSWSPEDNDQLALDEDSSWYDAEMETPVTESRVWQDQKTVNSTSTSTKPKKKRVRSETARWTGSTFKKSSLADIGLEIHLNHATIPRDIQLLHRGLYPASHSSTRTCATFDLLQVLHMFMLTSKLSIYDSYRALERLTDNVGNKFSRKKYRPLLRMTLQRRHLKMLKRGGRGHQLSGVDGTKEGELAIQCPTCPRPGINLPHDWRDAPDEKKFLYMMILCMDANFRLKNQLVSNYSTDPGLGTGWSYMVMRKPYEEYISSCVGFQAMSQSVTRFSRGLRYTGVGGVFCARSEMVLLNGVGNLQKGERYANMDMVFASAICGTQLAMIAISYDIVCQWFINLFNHMSKWPEPLHHEQYLCNLAEGVGKCDCEGCERFWAGHNALSNATKTQGPGSRQDVLDDHFSFWNWEKYAGLGLTLLWRYIAAIIERNRQVEAHRGFTNSLSTEVIKEWEEICSEWDNEDVPKTCLNPYKINGLHMTKEQAREELDKDEKAKFKATGYKINATSPSVFMAIALDLEESQPYAERPDVNVSWEADPYPELVNLHFPLQISVEHHKSVCYDGLPAVEEILRTAQCQDSLDALRHTLQVKSRMVYFKHKNIRGQREGTQSRDIIDRIHKKALIQVAKYRIARSAKLALCVEHTWETVLQPLLDRDPRQPWRKAIWEDGQQPVTTEEIEIDIQPIESSRKKKKLRKEGTGRTKQTVLWIWRNSSININDNEAVNQESDILRSEWLRSRARVRRSREEVAFLVEEMRRDLASMNRRACWWEDLMHVRTEVPPDLAEGLVSYSTSQAGIQQMLCKSFTAIWKTPLERMEQFGYNDSCEDNEDKSDDGSEADDEMLVD
ncbi:hypothetical protein CPB83DRAFT_871878 [Crepidotus variabilis]|uniref:CxC2-like cysteine cluster KDZ transposase-associated domain-containing protein n=1 Tax=Crepidotus variabilis TaxID=179855 RepID=A0A9P6JIY0_9AGAR|nr:hypothetical protein CPB83DRAFT_871878 [Crepidotus variabilis]